VERAEPDRAHDAGEHAPGELATVWRLRLHRERQRSHQCEPGKLRDEEHPHDVHAPGADPAAEVGDAPREARGEREYDAGQSGTGRVAATASSWFAWYRTAASAVRAARASWWHADSRRPPRRG